MADLKLGLRPVPRPLKDELLLVDSAISLTNGLLWRRLRGEGLRVRVDGGSGGSGDGEGPRATTECGD